MAMTGIPWLFEKFSRPSEKNGLIEVNCQLGRWSVIVDGCEQTTPYTHAMWTDAIKRLRRARATPIKKILLLGLAAGGELKGLNKAFPGCEITAVEHDPQMIALTRELGLYKPYPLPRILESDAASAIIGLTEQFDLCMVDLFTGEHASPLITQPSFLQTLARSLAPDGLLLVNVYKQPHYLDAAAKIFDKTQRWTFRYNEFGLFSHPKA
jgi:spermidine synthase